MRFGLTTPVVTLPPRSHAPWEAEAGPHELRQIVQAADRLGFHHVTCSEHIGIPGAAVSARGRRYYDPLATLGYVAALTTRVRLATHVVVLPYHHPLAVAKRYGTLDRLSGGRVILGVGIGSLEEEFDLLGAAFADRGPRYEDALRALRAALEGERPAYEGPHYRFRDFVIDPPAVQRPVPIWIGGRSRRSLRRALLFADGWVPFALGVRELGDALAWARQSPAWTERRAGFDLVLSLERLLDARDAGERRALVDLIGAYERIGATVLTLRFKHRSLAHYLEQLEIFATEIVPAFPDRSGRGP
jgi:probable F420-dependent oxidoreductase